jgi:site-specific DNA-adenine methylase
MGEKIPNLHLDQLNKVGYTQLLTDFNQGKFTGVEQSVAYMIATIYGRNSSVSTDLVTRELKGGIGPLDYSIRAAQKLTEHQTVLSEGRHAFVNGSYQDITVTADDFVYMDPPYLASSYRYSGWTENDERELLAWIDQLPCPWALSNTFQSGDKVNSILIDWARDKQVIELNKRYRIWANRAETAKRTPKINREVLIKPL